MNSELSLSLWQKLARDSAVLTSAGSLFTNSDEISVAFLYSGVCFIDLISCKSNVLCLCLCNPGTMWWIAEFDRVDVGFLANIVRAVESTMHTLGTLLTNQDQVFNKACGITQ